MEAYNEYDLYNDIQMRTGGEIYIGVVGPVRTGKSTFIKNFMELLVIPTIEDVHNKEQAIDELPQSAQGRTIMTTEPKFIPKESAEIPFGDGTTAKIRLIDCVGFMVEGAGGHIENEQERMVKTPWFDYEIPFTQAAEIGTRKVITDHSTVGIMVTCDGSFGELPRENYMDAEERTVSELKKLKKPFIILLNTEHPFSAETKALAGEMKEKYGAKVLPVSCKQLKKDDINQILRELLQSFPITRINFMLPKWAELLENSHWLKQDCLKTVRNMLNSMNQVSDAGTYDYNTDSEYIDRMKLEKVRLEDGTVDIQITFDNKYYYEILSDLVGVTIEDEQQLISILKELSANKEAYDKLSEANEQVKFKGYGVVIPAQEEIVLEEPSVVRHGGKYGVKIKAVAPSVHMIKANIETEIAPIVGTQEQANDLIRYINENAANGEEGIWDTNIFGKTVRQLVDEGIKNKVNKLTDESQIKLQETIQKVINDSNGGLVCIII